MANIIMMSKITGADHEAFLITTLEDTELSSWIAAGA